MLDAQDAALSDWIGRNETRQDRVSLDCVRGFEAVVNDRHVEKKEGDAAPLLLHWLMFQEVKPLSETGPDGHGKRGDFLPPIALPRRMWAGGRIDFVKPLMIGAAVERRSRIEAISEKAGRQGPLVLVTLAHEISDSAGVVLKEQQDLVYRAAPQPGTAPPATEMAPPAPDWAERIEPTPLMLFRYSALTMNGHRIHYDQPYATAVEGYSGLVVHGPLLATYLLSRYQATPLGAEVKHFAYRALRPVFDTAPFDVCGSLRPEGAELFIRDTAGHICMKAEVSA